MELQSYLTPVDAASLAPIGDAGDQHLLYHYIDIWQSGEPALDGHQFALIGVPEARNAFNNDGCHLAPNEIRRSLYALYRWNKPVSIIDLGNLKVGETVEDTYDVLTEMLATH